MARRADCNRNESLGISSMSEAFQFGHDVRVSGRLKINLGLSLSNHGHETTVQNWIVRVDYQGVSRVPQC